MSSINNARDRFLAAERYMSGFRAGARGEEREPRQHYTEEFLAQAYASGWAAGFAAFTRARDETERRYMPPKVPDRQRPVLRLIRGGAA